MHYSKAPIVEAIIDLHFAYEAAPTFEELEGYAASMRDRFPQCNRVDQLQLAFGPNSAQHSQHAIGLRLSSSSNDRVLLLRTAGLTFSHLPPYSDWKSFREDALGIWRGFSAKFPIRAVSRLAVRYINKISIPHQVDISEYSNLYPLVPDGFGDSFEGYFMQLSMNRPAAHPDCKILVNSGLQADASPNTFSILLDIDVFCQAAFPSDPDSVFSLLDKLRVEKNTVFESTITDKVREAIK